MFRATRLRSMIAVVTALSLLFPMQSFAAQVGSEIFPDDTAIYFDLDLNAMPQNDLVAALKSLAGELSSSLPADAGADLIRKLVENGKFSYGLRAPVGGETDAMYATFAITDKQFEDYLVAEEDTLEKKTYQNHTYYLKDESAMAKIGDSLLLTSQEDAITTLFKKIDAGEVLAKSSGFSSTLGKLSANRFLGYFMDFQTFVSALGETLSADDGVSNALDALKHMGASIHSFDGGLSFDTINVRSEMASGDGKTDYSSSPFTPTMYQYATSKKPLLYLEASNAAKAYANQEALVSGLVDEETVWVEDLMKLVSKGYSFTVENGGGTLIPSLTFMADVSGNEPKALDFLKKMYDFLLNETLEEDVKILLDPDSKALSFRINMPEEFDNDVADLLPPDYILEVSFKVTSDDILVITTNSDWEKQYKTGVDMNEFGAMMQRNDVIGLFSMNLQSIKDIVKQFIQKYYNGLDAEFQPYFRVEDALKYIEQIFGSWHRLSGSWMTSGLTDQGSLKLYVDSKVYTQAYWQEAIASAMKLDDIFNQYDKVSQRFDDVKQDEWFYSDVRKLKAKGIVKGYGDDEFRPGQNVTRIEFLAMLYRGIYEDPSTIAFPGFTGAEQGLLFNDVELKSWYYGTLEDAYKKGLIKGYDDGSFRPGSPISRAEAVAMMHRFYEYNNEAEFFADLEAREDDRTFSDVSDKAWFHGSVKEAYRLGVIDGTPAGKFEPARNLNRAEAAKLINKFLRKKGAEPYRPHVD